MVSLATDTPLRLRFLLFVLLLALSPAAHAAHSRQMITVIVAHPSELEEDIVARAQKAAATLAARGRAALPPESLTTRLRTHGWPHGWPAPAETASADQVRALLAPLEHATERLFAGEFDDAAARYAAGMAAAYRAQHLFADRPAAHQALLDHGLRHVRLLRGLERQDEANAALAALAARGAPSARPDIAEHPPALIEELEIVRAKVRTQTLPVDVRVVRLSGTDDVCRVFANGVEQPLPLRLPPGCHTLQARCGPHVSTLRRFQVDAAAAASGPTLVLSPEIDAALHFDERAGLILRMDPLPPDGAATIAAVTRSALDAPQVAVAFEQEGAERLFLSDASEQTPQGEALLGVVMDPRPRIWSYVTLGVGLALVSTGGYFHWATADATRRINAGEQLLHRRETSRVRMWSLYGAGAAALAGSALLFIFEPGLGRGGEERWIEVARTRRLNLGVVPEPLGLRVGGRF
jgi:hypothetical protein